MSWHNLSEQEFDKALRNHLQDPEIPFDPVSWEKMTRKLDTFYLPGNRSSGFFPSLALIILLSTVFFWSLITLSQSGDQLDNINQVIVHNGQAEMPGEDEFISNYEFEQAEANTLNSERDNGYQQNKAPVNPQKLTGSKEPKHTTEEFSDTSVEPFKETAVERSGVQEPDHSAVNSNKQSLQLAGNHASTDSEMESNLQEYIETLELLADDEPPVIKHPNRSPWSVGIGYAPDFSLVGSGSGTSPGTNLGLTIEYRIGTRWSLQTGATYSMKRYTAAGEDYNPPPGFWYYGREPDNTEGECDVIDVPLNVRYYFRPNQNGRFFASTGISSYLMLTEDYYYKYEGYQNPNQVDSWSVRNENQHYFGVYNLSVGYQKSLGTRWALEIEPFIKLPLSGVGFGRVNLWSTGSTFSFKYNFK